MRFVRVSGLAALAAGLVLGCGGALAASAEKGKTAFVQHGCWQCHGFQGQGGVTGPKLAPEPLPLETFTAFVRTSNRAMPPYMEAILSNEDLADIHAYLETVPEAARSQEHSAAQPVGQRAARSIGPAWCRADAFLPPAARKCSSGFRGRAPAGRSCSRRSRS